MPHRLLSVRQTVVDTFANDFAKIVAYRLWNILAHDISAKRQRQSGLLFPPLAKIDHFLKSRFLIGELSLVNDQPNIRSPGADRVENLVERHYNAVELPKKKL